MANYRVLTYGGGASRNLKPRTIKAANEQGAAETLCGHRLSKTGKRVRAAHGRRPERSHLPLIQGASQMTKVHSEQVKTFARQRVDHTKAGASSRAACRRSVEARRARLPAAAPLKT